ncbi:MAG TPA: TlyA family RNA methyltransferase [Verrucomicrobiales bacterium]|nr:TlyA family RNA methyltransferase [Verrucomicrobiales bacterium]
MKPGGSARNRLDQELAQRGLCPSREVARRLILAGKVTVGGRLAGKPGMSVPADAEIVVKEGPRFVSRGGDKLEGALEAFGIEAREQICLDAGASTGGFTDCLLQRGAARVYAFDAGFNQLAWKLRSDPRVVVRERFNLRYLQPADVSEPIDLLVVDVSFISLTLVLPPCLAVLRDGGQAVCLIKPQFELQRGEVGRGGVVRDEELRQKAPRKIESFVAGQLGMRWMATIDSRLPGATGNREFFGWIRKE